MKIYIVIQSGGSYEDYYCRNVKAFTSKNAAEAFCIEAGKKADEVYRKLREARKEWGDKSREARELGYGHDLTVFSKFREEYEEKKEIIEKSNLIDPEINCDDASDYDTGYGVEELELEKEDFLKEIEF